ncbi:GSCOCG00001182001-RA-CDS, partial [Cotesia congregata]
MTTLILGIGVGLFVILTLWLSAALIFAVSFRIDKKIGAIAIIVAVIITIVLVSVPRSSEYPSSFQEKNTEFVSKVMNSKVPVIVNFHAEWCDPCKILTPKLEKLIGPMENLNLAIVDVERNPELVHTFEVKAVPAVIAVSNGLVIDKFIGLVDANMIDNLIKKLT